MQAMDSFMTKESGQDLSHVDVLLPKKSNLKEVFIRINNPYLAICLPPLLL